MNESLKNWEGGGWVRVDFAKKLEQERDEAREKLNTNLVEFSSKLVVAIRERDEARERCADLEQAMSYSSGATTLLSRFLKILNERNDLVQKLELLRIQ